MPALMSNYDAQSRSEHERSRFVPIDWLEMANEADTPTFAEALRSGRKQLACKQLALAYAIGCTEAAFSLWETGSRLPTPKSLSRILAAFTTAGLATVDLLALRNAWRAEAIRRTRIASR
jgi:DNA-binding transcriptional regulator YiaG